MGPCKTCEYFVRASVHLGQCRRHAPQPGTTASVTRWLLVAPDDGCGEYQHDSEKDEDDPPPDEDA